MSPTENIPENSEKKMSPLALMLRADGKHPEWMTDFQMNFTSPNPAVAKKLLTEIEEQKFISDSEKKVVAYHEIGHALVAGAAGRGEAFGGRDVGNGIDPQSVCLPDSAQALRRQFGAQTMINSRSWVSCVE